MWAGLLKASPNALRRGSLTRVAHTCGGSDWWHQEENVVSLVAGDELRLKYAGDPLHSGWQSVGHVVRGKKGGCKGVYCGSI